MNTATSPSAIVPFCFNDHLIRTAIIDEDPWFVAKDICDVLEHSNCRKAVEGLDDDEKGLRKVQTPGGDQEMSIISESGLYTLIIRSNKPQAKPFRKWVTAEVLPSIRKTGGYQAPNQDKTVQMRHTVIRGSNAPGGLDIPINEEVGERAAEIVQGFLAARCRFKPGATVLFASVYAAYRQHCGEAGDVLPGQIVSRVRLSRLLAAGGFSCQKVGGTSKLIDTALLPAEEVAAC